MRPDLVFSEESISPSLFFTTPAKKPRTECGCQPVTFEIAAMVVPPLAWSRPSTRSCLVVPPLERDARCVLFFVFDLSCFAGLVRGLSFVLDLAMRTSEVGDTIVAPPRPRPGQPPAGFSPKAPLRRLWPHQQRSVRSRSPVQHPAILLLDHIYVRLRGAAAPRELYVSHCVAALAGQGRKS